MSDYIYVGLFWIIIDTKCKEWNLKHITEKHLFNSFIYGSSAEISAQCFSAASVLDEQKH